MFYRYEHYNMFYRYEHYNFAHGVIVAIVYNLDDNGPVISIDTKMLISEPGELETINDFFLPQIANKLS